MRNDSTTSPQKHPDPKNVPVDFYTPTFFNDILSVQERVDCWKNGVALPQVEYCQTWEDVRIWIELPEEEFMEKYGNAVLALYRYPTAAQMERLEQQQKYHVGKRRKSK